MVSTKIRPLGVMILGMLREGDMHPYEMMRLMRARRDDRLVTIQNGTFYHQVATLLRDGFIDEVGVDREGNRPERMTYTLRDEGDRAVTEWVRSRLGRIDKPGDFRIALAESHNLPREEAISLLRQRTTLLHELHDEQRALLDLANSRAIDPQFLVEAERDTVLIAADIAWTNALLEALESPSYAWGQSSPQLHTSPTAPRTIDSHKEPDA